MISALQHESKYKSKFNFDLFFKRKSNLLVSIAVVLMKTFPLMYQLLATVGLILTKLGHFFP